MSEHHSFEAEEILIQIGQRLKAAREAKGLTLQEVSNRTRIHLGSLEKIESGDLKNLPGLAFVRGFIRNFLQVLELEDEQIEEGIAKFSSVSQFARETALGPTIRELHGDDEPRGSRTPILIGLAVVLGLWGGYMGYRVFSQPSVPEATPPTVASPAPEPPPAQPASTGTPSAQPAGPGAPETLGAAPQPAAPDPPPSRAFPVGGSRLLKLTVRGLEPTWVRLSIDRAPPIEVRMEPAETLNWEANEEIRLTVGRSNGVAVYLNGEDILLPNERNRLVPTIVLNKLTLLRLEN